MKNIYKSICAIFAVLLIISIFRFPPVFAKDKVNVKAGAVYIDKGEDIVTGVEFDKNYINSITVSSSDPTIATGSFDKEKGTLTIQGLKKGKATISFDGYHKVGDTTAIVNYEVNVIDVFDAVTFSYYYNTITVNYDKNAIPEGCTPVFSLDEKNWSESSTLTRGANDTIIYKAYNVNGVISGSVKSIPFDNKYNQITETKEKIIEITPGETYSIKNELSLTYNYYLINGRNNIIFNEDDLSFTATDLGNTTLTIVSSSTPSFSEDGTVSSRTVEYNFKIKVKESTEEVAENASEYNSQDSSEDKNNNSSEDKSLNGSTEEKTDDGSGGSSETGSDGSTDNASETNSGSNSENSSIINTTGQWKQDGNGWWFEKEDGTYPVWEWLYIDDHWYFFDRNGYMDSNGYRFGCWLRGDGSWDYSYSGGRWKSDSTGWWYEDGGWYPVNEWLKIDGYWYYFKSDGYMALNEYIDGYWLDADGAWK